MLMGSVMSVTTIKWILVLLYVFMSCLYAYDRFWNYGRLQEALFTLLLCVTLPVVGFIFVWIKDYYAEKKEEKDFSEIFEGDAFFRDELKMLKPLDRDKELNRVPMKEALIINDYELRRKMVMDTLTEDNTLEYIDVLQEALENEDSETSHYASSIIMQLQAKVQNRMTQREKEFERNPQDRKVMVLYERELFQLLTSRLLEKDNLRRYFMRYAKLSNRLLEEQKPEEEYILHRVQICFLERNFTETIPILERYLELYPKSEDAVLCKIKLCIYTKDRKGLESFMNSLSSRPVILTQKTLEYVRFFRNTDTNTNNAELGRGTV